MDIKVEIKQESGLSQFCSQKETGLCFEDHLVEVRNESVACDTENKMDETTDIKEESFVLDPFSQNDKELVRELKSDTVTSGNKSKIDVKTEIQGEAVDLKFGSQNVRELCSIDAVMEVNECNKHYEMDCKIEFKEEQWWLESSSRDAPALCDEIKDEMPDDFPSTRLYKEAVSSDKPSLTPNQNFGKDKSVNMRNDSAECKSPRKCKSQENICSEPLESGKMHNTTSCFKQNSLILRNNIHKEKSCKNYTREYKCDICDKTFTLPSKLKTHKFIHEFKMPHKCDTCGKSFTRLSHLKMHKLIHEGRKPHKCDACEKSFLQMSHLNRHKLIHEGKKVYKCDICEKCFSDSSNLSIHKLNHEGRKPHKCESCGLCFTRLSSLNRHILIHQGKKPHNCDTCGKCFIRLSGLNRHMLIHKGSTQV